MTRKIKNSNITPGALTSASLNDTGVTAGQYGSSTAIPVITTNAKGQLTAVTTASLPSNLATETYVTTAISNLVDSAPTTLDTLNELAAALGDDSNFATTVTTALGTKFNTSDFNTTFDTRLGTKSTSNLTEGSNLYYTDARARSAISVSGSLTYNSTTGVISSNLVDTTNASNITSGTLATARLPSGAVLQVQQSVITSAFTMGTSDWTDIPSFSCNITPISASSKIVVYIFTGSITAGGNAIDYRIVRNGNAIGIGDGAGSRDRVTTRTMREGDTNHVRAMPTVIYVDTPSTTSVITYKIQVKNEGNGTIFFNRAQTDTDTSNAYGGRSISTIVLMEVA